MAISSSYLNELLLTSIGSPSNLLQSPCPDGSTPLGTRWPCVLSCMSDTRRLPFPGTPPSDGREWHNSRTGSQKRTNTHACLASPASDCTACSRDRQECEPTHFLLQSPPVPLPRSSTLPQESGSTSSCAAPGRSAPGPKPPQQGVLPGTLARPQHRSALPLRDHTQRLHHPLHLAM